MGTKWTNEQTQAIHEKGENILVAAAAGSGKTAVLVERIINKIINENIDIDKMLVVTFTNAAAAEMRERVFDAIYKRLEECPENEHLQNQIVLLNKSSICTIDSFCLDVIKNNFYELDISPNFRIADTAEMELLKQEVLEDVFDEKYETNDENFIKLLYTYTSYKDDTPLKELVLKIYNYIQSDPFPEKWLNEKIEMFNIKDNMEEDFGKTIWGKILLDDLKEEVIDCQKILEQIKNELKLYDEMEKYYIVICEDINELEKLEKNLQSWNTTYCISNDLKFSIWPRSKETSEIKEKAKNIRDKVRKKLKDKINKIMIFTSEEANTDISEMYEMMKNLKELILYFGKKLDEKKKEKNMVDFSDIEHFALNLLIKNENGKIIKTEVAKRIQSKYHEIAIDEYQDSNLVQEYILTAVSKENNIFMVGDVKQSIYKFRQARPELFLDKYERYVNKVEQKDNEDVKIQLYKNFRSRKNILDYTNIIFSNIMSKQLGDINYTESEYLNLGANFKEIENRKIKNEIDIINLSDNLSESKTNDDEINENEEEDHIIENTEIEAKFVAKKIEELIKSKFQVYDLKKQEFRNIKYKDIVILLRSTKIAAPIFEQELINLELPVFSDSSSEYLNSIEIQTIICLLKIIDNPIQDIPLVTVMRSSIGEFTDNDLIEIRLSDKHGNFYDAILNARINVNKELKEKIDNFLEKLDKWREEQEYFALDELIWKIYNDTGFFDYVGLLPNGMLRQANLKILFERAKQYEKASFKGLFNFIKFIERLQVGSGDLSSAKIIGENDDVIRIMSIHKSKGLEFPVVFLSSTGKQFNLMDLNKDILLHQDMGIGVKYIDYDRHIEYDTLSKEAIRKCIFKETLSEEMRILYVALTRAKEKIFITGMYNDFYKENEKMLEDMQRYKIENGKINPILLKKYKKYIDWINLVYLYNLKEAEDLVDFNVIYKSDILNKTKIENEKVNYIDSFEKELNEEQYKKYNQFSSEVEEKYKYINSITIPTKMSVTQVKELLEDNEIISKENTNKESNFYKESEFPKPEFLKDSKEEIITNAKKGTLIHLCMQKLNLKIEYTRSKIQELISDLYEKNIISEKEAQSIDIEKIYQFANSDIWKEIKKAKEVYREKPFYIEIPSKEIFVDKKSDEKILVQGIIDIFYINNENEITLLDYKTDYIKDGEESILVSKYKKQLEIYKKAIEYSYKCKVNKIYIYSTCLGKKIKIGETD